MPSTKFGLNGRRFGVEIEYRYTHEDDYDAEDHVAKLCARRGLKVGYNCENDEWESGTDYEGELRSPILSGAEGERQVIVACEALEDYGAWNDVETGLHVHHDAKGLGSKSIARLLRNYSDSQVAIDQMVSESRRDGYNSYCKRIREFNVDDLATSVDRRDLVSKARNQGRFFVVNANALVYHGTLEFRQHEGTCDANSILSWVAFGQAMIKAATRGTRLKTDDTQLLLERLGSHGLTDYSAELLFQKTGLQRREQLVLA